MEWNDMYIAGTGASFPQQMSVAKAVEQGLYERSEADRTGQLAATVADPDDSAIGFAVAAGLQALGRAGPPATDVGVLLHLVTLHAGLDAWNSAAFVQRELGLGANLPLAAEVRIGCDGLAALELACSYLQVHQNYEAGVITAADVWPTPLIDRWRAESGLVFGDGGTALVISRRPGFARIISTVSVTDPSLEGLHRGCDSFSPSRSSDYTIDFNARARAFLRTMPRGEILRRKAIGLRRAVETAVGEADCSVSNMDHVVLQFLGADMIEREFLGPLGLRPERTTFQFGCRIGHLGSADIFAGLNHLVEARKLAAGDRILAINSGGGYIWTSAVFQVIDVPTVVEE